MTAAVYTAADPAGLLASHLAEVIIALPRVCMAVSGGGTPKALFRLLSEEYGALPWGRVHLFQVDERCVPPDHAESNWRMITEALLDHLRLAAAHRIEAERGPAGAADYEALLRAEVPARDDGVPVLDLALLGMGADGHTASLFPGTAALAERARLVVHQAVPQLGTQRVTMTYPLLNAARRRWFLVQGAEKAKAFARAQRGEGPAGRVRDAVWYLDADAGAMA